MRISDWSSDVCSSDLQNDKPGYISYCLANTRTQHGIPPTTFVASLLFNLVTTVVESEGDVWFHREKDELWWSKSLPVQATSEAATAPQEKTGKAHEIILHLKPSHAWSDTDSAGRRLRWSGLHPKARTFLFTEGTLQKLSKENADYALALIAGEDLSKWEARPDWQAVEAKAGKGAVTFADDRRRAIMTMVIQAEDTCRGANGQRVERNVKKKNFEFPPRDAPVAYQNALTK